MPPRDPMPPEIVCPEDLCPLAESRGSLLCPRGHRFAVRGGIPRLVDQESNYADAFGLQWKTYRQTQLDSHTRTTLSSDRARRCLGEECWTALHASAAMDVLEVGCGAGRFTEVLLGIPGTRVTSVDFSSAVEANLESFPSDERHRVIQSDVLRLPFAPEQFDVVFCLGVVQHTPDPEATLAKLYEQVEPGGWLTIDHYTYNLSRYTKLAPLLRQILMRLPPERGHLWTERIVKLFFPLHRAVRRRRLLQMLLSRISPVLTYFHALPHLGDALQYELALLDTHDSLTDRYKHYRTRGQIERALRALGATAVECERGGNGVEARCRRP